MLRQDDQFVGGQFDWFIGVVEDTNDPELLNRVKVRCFGYHTDDKGEVSTADLPFATVMMPNTSPSVEGIGQNHQLLSGSWVVGFFRDGPSAQDPIILGSIMSFTETARDTNLGFSGTFGNKAGLSDVPLEVDSLNANQVTKTVSGHLIELDNTSGSERINIQHKSGTTINIAADGTVFVNASNTTVDITGNTTIHGNLLVNGTTHSTGDVSTDAGNAPTLATHTHTEVPGTGGSSSPIPGTQETSVAN